MLVCSPGRYFRAATLGTLLVTLLVASPQSARAGAWAQEDKGLYAKLTVAHGRARAQYKSGGDTFQLLSEDEPGRFTSTAALIYAEFGLLPRLTFLASTSWMTGLVESDLIRARTSGMTDFRSGLRFQWLDAPVVASLQAQVGVPTGYTPDPRELKAPTLGTGVTTGELQLMVGKSFHPIPLYVSAQGGLRLRGSRRSRRGGRVDYPPEAPYSVEVGWSFLDWAMLRVLARGVQGLGDPENLDTFTLTPLTQSYTKVGPSLIFTIADRIQINADYLYTALGVNAVKSHDFMLGVAVDTTL